MGILAEILGEILEEIIESIIEHKIDAWKGRRESRQSILNIPAGSGPKPPAKPPADRWSVTDRYLYVSGEQFPYSAVTDVKFVAERGTILLGMDRLKGGAGLYRMPFTREEFEKAAALYVHIVGKTRGAEQRKAAEKEVGYARAYIASETAQAGNGRKRGKPS